MKKNDSIRNSMWTAILWGLLIAILFSILGAAIGASIINSGKISEGTANWVTGLVWGISVFCGIMLTLKLNKEIITAAITTGGYTLIVTGINLLFMEQNLCGFGRFIFSVLIGSAVALLLNLNNKKAKGRKKRYRPR